MSSLDIRFTEHRYSDRDCISMSMPSGFKCPYCDGNLMLIRDSDREGTQVSCSCCRRMKFYSKAEWNKIETGESKISRDDNLEIREWAQQ